jgi:predicted metal-dependent hydrolase
LNHSRKFWGLVAKAFPDYRNLHRELRDYRIARF